MFDRAQTLDHTDPEKPFVTSGVRLGSPAITTRGFGVEEVAALTGRFPVFSPPAA